jgi:DNA-binding LacI/PurR family transcriptional regulator
MACENIAKLGYQRIGLVTSRSTITRDKAGFLMKQIELPAKQRVPVLLLSTGADSSLDFTPLACWLKKAKPDAILSDIASLPEMLKQMGYRIPQDIGIATTSVLDGNADAGIDQNSEHIGMASAEMVISQINHNYYGVPKVCSELLIEGKWVNGTTLPRK